VPPAPRRDGSCSRCSSRFVPSGWRALTSRICCGRHWAMRRRRRWAPRCCSRSPLHCRTFACATSKRFAPEAADG
jgi:hypothetical protein